jgi:hypothetical protein
MTSPGVQLVRVADLEAAAMAHPDSVVTRYVVGPVKRWRDVATVGATTVLFHHPRQGHASAEKRSHAILAFRDGDGWRRVELNPRFAD